MTRADLTGADLKQSRVAADFTGAILDAANLSGADFSADMKNRSMGLMRGVLHKARAAGANFEGASLMRADLEFAILTDDSLRSAALSMATLEGANLTDADVTLAKFLNTDVTSTRLLRIKGSDDQTFRDMKNLESALR